MKLEIRAFKAGMAAGFLAKGGVSALQFAAAKSGFEGACLKCFMEGYAIAWANPSAYFRVTYKQGVTS